VATSCDKGIDVFMIDITLAVHLPHDREFALDSNTETLYIIVQLQLTRGNEVSLMMEYILSCSAGVGEAPHSGCINVCMLTGNLRM
jgi:hypothetical protein